MNPMVSNMMPAYNAAKFNIIWVATSRVQGNVAVDLILFPYETASNGKAYNTVAACGIAL